MNFKNVTGVLVAVAVLTVSYPAQAGIISTIKIDDSVANGPQGLTTGDRYGEGLSLAGDFDNDGTVDLLVGASLDEALSAGSQTEVGAIHIHYLNPVGSTNPVKETKRIDTDSTNGPNTLQVDALYGLGVTMLGDYDANGVGDIAVGAPFTSQLAPGSISGSDERGMVYLHAMNANGTVKQTLTLDATTPNGPNDYGLPNGIDDGDRYGYAVEAIGDIEGNGVPDIAVGAPQDEGDVMWGALDRTGAIYLHALRQNGTLRGTRKITGDTPSGPVLETGDQYGASIAMIPDLNPAVDPDNVQEIVVGAIGTDGGKGAVHLHLMNTNGFPMSTIKIDSTTPNGPTNLAAGAQYGTSVSYAGDLNGDGIPDIAVGAPFQPTAGGSGPVSGAVYIHFMDTDGSIKATEILDSTTTNGAIGVGLGDRYGSSITNLGDLNGDNIDDLAIGAYLDEGVGIDTGAVHIHYMSLYSI